MSRSSYTSRLLTMKQMSNIKRFAFLKVKFSADASRNVISFYLFLLLERYNSSPWVPISGEPM